MTPESTCARNVKAERNTALVIDDDAMVRASMVTVLEVMGYVVETAGDGEEALPMLASGNYAVIFCDILMPRMKGTELYAHVVSRDPEMAGRFIFVTGWSGTARDLHVVNQSGQPCLHKPFHVHELIAALRGIITDTSS